MSTGRKVKSLWVLVFVLLCAGLPTGVLAGCKPLDKPVKETEERAYRRGKSLLREGRKDEALQAFLSVVSARPDAAESHLEAGLLYLNHIKDPLAAIYHFRNYLALAPQGEYAEFVKELILTAQKDFAQTLPGEPFGNAVENVNLMETVKALKEETTQQKQQIMDLQRQLEQRDEELQRNRQSLVQAQTQVRTVQSQQTRDVAPIIIQTPAAQAPEGVSSARSYTVQPGDTLSRISARFYGDSGKWKTIYEANRDQLPTPNALKVGQVLRIP